jgi:Zn-dependent protease with chaperone function
MLFSGVNNPNRGFDACLFHPDLGNESVEGKMFADFRRLRFESTSITVEIPLERLTLDYDHDTGRINFTDRDQPAISCFTTDDSILNHWALVRSNHTRHQIRRMMTRSDISRRIKITLGALMACALLIWAGSFVFDAIVHSVVMQIPSDWEREFGDKQLLKLRERMDFLDDTNREAQLAMLAEPLTRGISGRSNEFKFHLVQTSAPNALALPGGHVIVTTGLLDTVGEPEELLGVIAHEIAHVRRRHGFQQAISGAGPVLVLKILMSDRNNRLNLMAQISGLLIFQSFSQNHEREADDAGWDYLVAANVNPHGMIDMLSKLRAEEGPESSRWEAFSSHPALEKRIRRLEARWDRLPRKTGFLTVTNPVTALPHDEPFRQFEKRLDKLLKAKSH